MFDKRIIPFLSLPLTLGCADNRQEILLQSDDPFSKKVALAHEVNENRLDLSNHDYAVQKISGKKYDCGLVVYLDANLSLTAPDFIYCFSKEGD